MTLPLNATRARALLRALMLAACLPLAACSSGDVEASAPAETVTVTETVEAGSDRADDSIEKGPSDSETDTPAESSNTIEFADGVLTTPELRIEITRHEVIGVGEEGNEYGEKPVIAFWYETTNLGDEDVSPMNFIYNFTAYQDNNPDSVNEIEIASLPDDRFLDSQSESIKQGGTVENAIAYELDDTTTPVDLVATDMLGEVFGQTTYDIS